MTSARRVAWLGLVVTLPASAGAEELGYQLETSVASAYVARGIIQYADRNAPSSQSTGSLRIPQVGSGALSFLVWNAVALSDYRQQPGTALEIDLTTAYAFRAGPLDVTAGYTAYLFPDHMAGTPLDGAHEVSGIVSYGNAYVVPSLAAYVEVARQQGMYLSLGGTRDLHYAAWTFSPAVSVAGATYRKYLGQDRSAAPHLNDVTAMVAARRDFAEGVYATARLSYSFCGTPSDLLPMDPSWGFDGRSSLFGVLAVGFAR